MKAGRQIKHPSIALCVDRSQGYGSTVLRGVAKYVETYGPWALFIDMRFSGDYAQNWLRQWKGDGILAYVEDARLARTLRNSSIPTVEMFGHRYDLGLPQVCPDNEGIGKLAAHHLLERKFRHFTFCGYSGRPFSGLRQKGFVETLEKAGFPCAVHLVPRHAGVLKQWHSMQQLLVPWLVELPKPNGIMACSDRHAQRVLDACRRANISVPEEIAVIGSGNDEELCRLSNPPLTSVTYDIERAGFEAAQLLHQLLEGKKHETLPQILIPPNGIVTRKSTDITAIDDQFVASTVRHIREHACNGLTVNEILSEFRISRSAFYGKFEKAMGRSPHDEILRVKLERARNLLTQTDLAIERIAEMSGFDNTEYLYVVFKRSLGMTPRQHRLQHGKRLK
ncbi:MAG: DNA-binding transcriptional regulator [Verrucomicrobia bacterium]|nr:DNA-binding transcriptional regulator [Verrucomicrobiota bacterium]